MSRHRGPIRRLVEAGAEGHERVVVCVVLDGKCEPGGRGRNGYLSIERYTKEHTGWIYTGVEGIPELYNRLFYEELEAQDFPRPPGVMLSRDFISID